MAGQSWSINIVPRGKGVQFNPDVDGAEPGKPLKAQIGDLVSWNNQTDAHHQIVIEGEKFPVKPWSSTDAFEIPAGADNPLWYKCDKRYKGQIEVVP